MSKYHINPDTGDAGLCQATKRCPFGGDDAHFTSKIAAQRAYEEGLVGIPKSSIPNLHILVDNAPPGERGVKQAYEHIRGVQIDLDEGLIDEERARQRLAQAHYILKLAIIAHNKTSTPHWDFAGKIALHAADESHPIPIKQPAWMDVAPKVNLVKRSEISAIERKLIDDFTRYLFGNAPGYKGYSDSMLLNKAKQIVKRLNGNTNPELKNLRETVIEALAKDGRRKESAS